MIHDENVKYRFATETLMLKNTKNKNNVVFGILKEYRHDEHRIPLTPSAVKKLVDDGNVVLVKKGAGNAAGFNDTSFSEAGALITDSKEEILNSDVLLKIFPPEKEEIEMMKNNAVLLSSLCLHQTQKSYLQHLSSKRITAISYELIQGKETHFPLLYAMSEIVGQLVVLIAASYLCDSKWGCSTLTGAIAGLPPIDVVVIGSGTVALNVCRVALGLGCRVSVFDTLTDRLRKLSNTFNNNIFTYMYDQDVLTKLLTDTEILVCAKHTSDFRSPLLVKESMVQQMKDGSVLVDVSIDQGGCCETSIMTTHSSPVFSKYGVTHYCVPNIASKVSHTASMSISNILVNEMLCLGRNGINGLLQFNDGFAKGVYMYNGKLTNRKIGDMLALPYKPLELFLPSFHDS